MHMFAVNFCVFHHATYKLASIVKGNALQTGDRKFRRDIEKALIKNAVVKRDIKMKRHTTLSKQVNTEQDVPHEKRNLTWSF